MDVKECQKCKVVQSVDNFNKRSKSKDGLQAWCKSCMKLAQRKTMSSASARARSRTRARLRKYGISAEELAQLETARKGRCDICGKSRKLVIDHDHKTGKVRGMLCSPCNTALGLFRDKPKIMRRAAKYVEYRSER